MIKIAASQERNRSSLRRKQIKKTGEIGTYPEQRASGVKANAGTYPAFELIRLERIRLGQ